MSRQPAPAVRAGPRRTSRTPQLLSLRETLEVGVHLFSPTTSRIHPGTS